MPRPRHNQTLEERARQLPRHTLPASLRERTLSALPDGKAISSPTTTRRAFVVTGALAAAGALGVFAGPRLFSVGTASLAAPEIRAALLRVNTWHLTGWKLQNGKKVSWEVWGRRRPFFYRETVGANITFDDGKTRVRLLAAEPRHGRPSPVALKMFPEPMLQKPAANTSANVVLSTRFVSPDSFLEDKRGIMGLFETISRTGNLVTLRRNEGEAFGAIREKFTRLLTVDVNTKLPSTFTWHVDRTPNPNAPAGAFVAPAKSYDSGFLQAEYDIPLSQSAMQIPADALVYDLTAPPPNKTANNAVTQSGMTIQPTKIMRDAQGNVRVIFEAWLGNQHLETKRSSLSIEMPWVQRSTMRDDQNRIYVQISEPPRVRHGDHLERYYVPLEPLSGNASPSRTLALNTYVFLQTNEVNPETHYAQSVDLLNESFHFDLELPSTVSGLGYEEITPDDCLGPDAHRWTLEEEIVQKRAEFYYVEAVHGVAYASGRARYWYREALKLSQHTGNKLLEKICRSNLKGLDRIQERMAKRPISGSTTH